MGRATSDRSLRRRRRLLTAVVVLVVVSPAVRDRDSFPLSTYPMYAGSRSDTAAFSTVVGVDADGARVPLSLPVIARTDDALVGQADVVARIDGAEAAALCAEVAARVPEDVAQVEVVTEHHDLVSLVTGEESLLDRNLHATCEATT